MGTGMITPVDSSLHLLSRKSFSCKIWLSCSAVMKCIPSVPMSELQLVFRLIEITYSHFTGLLPRTSRAIGKVSVIAIVLAKA